MGPFGGVNQKTKRLPLGGLFLCIDFTNFNRTSFPDSYAQHDQSIEF